MNLIKNIFIPESIGSYYIFSKRIVGIDIGKTQINATQIVAKGNSITIEKCIEEKLETGTAANYNERVIAALKNIFQQIDRYDALHVALTSSVAVFKELTVPFVDHDKIAMIIDFEVEPLLPFSINDAVVDFIITKQIPEEKSSDVLIAAVPKHHIVQILELFAAAGANPSLITIDFFALYNAYLHIPSYAQLTDGVVLIDFGYQSTRIAYIYNGQLRVIRTIAKTIFSIAKPIGEQLHVQPNEVMESLVRFGFEAGSQKEFTQTSVKAFTQFWQEIAFTLQSFTSGTDVHTIQTILLLGWGAEIKGVAELITTLTGIACKPFVIQKIVEDTAFTLSLKNSIPQACAISVSTALPMPAPTIFNLRKKEFSVTSNKVMIRNQVIAIISLLVLTFGILMTHSFLQIRTLKQELDSSQNEAISLLKEHFKSLPEDTQDLEEIVQFAEKEVKKENQLWFAFSPRARASFLQNLLELTSKIDKEGLDFTIEKLQMTDTMITMTAKVRDHDALIILEKELKQSKMFGSIGGDLNEPSFTMKIRLAKQR